MFKSALTPQTLNRFSIYKNHWLELVKASIQREHFEIIQELEELEFKKLAREYATQIEAEMTSLPRIAGEFQEFLKRKNAT